MMGKFPFDLFTDAFHCSLVIRKWLSGGESFFVFVGNIPDWGAGDLIRVFGVEGVVFDSFVPYDRRSGKCKNFAFVRFKTEKEMDAVIKMLDGKVFDGKKLKVNKAHFGLNNRRPGGKGREGRILTIRSKGKAHSSGPVQFFFVKPKPIHLISSDSDQMLVQVYESCTGKNIEFLNNTWLGLARKSDSSPHEIKGWLLEAWGFDLDVSVLILSPVLFWIVLASEEDRRRFRYGGSLFADGPLRRIDKWSESQGPILVVDWVWIHGILLHA